MSTTEGMKGGGYYDAHSEYQSRVAASGAALIKAMVAEMTLPAPDRPFTIVDYGCSEGGNSIAVAAAAVTALRRRNHDGTIVVLHNDLATNDFNKLFENLAAREDSYLGIGGGPIFPMVSAGSFFESVVPAETANIGLSFSAAHWLRTQPEVSVPDGIFFFRARGAARETLARQADADWTQFLAMRAGELAPGGKLLIQMVGSQPRQDDPTVLDVTSDKLLNAMNEVAREWVAEGRLDAGVLERYVFPVYARTPDEARAPIEREGSPVAGLFRIDAAETAPVPNPYYETWLCDRDNEKYARDYIAFVRAFSESSIRDGLLAPGAVSDNADALTENFYRRLERRAAADPEESLFEDWTLTVMLTRI